VTIAKKIDTSPYTITKRYEKMKKDGTIVREIVSIDLSKLGYQGKIFLMITNRSDIDKKLTIDALKKIKGIITVSEIIGAFDIIAIMPISDLNSVRALVKEVKKIPGVQQVEITCIEDNSFPINSSFGEVLSRKALHLANCENIPETEL
jgi:DNA-binding Lrp family transcriptional regulator